MESLVKEIKTALNIVKFDKEAINSIYNEKSSIKWGIFILFFPAFINIFLSSLTFPTGFSAIFSKFVFWPMIIPVLSLIIVVFAMSFGVRKYFKLDIDDVSFFRVASFASIVLWIAMIPLLLDALGLFVGYELFSILWLMGFVWILVFSYTFFVKFNNLDQKSALITVLLALFAYFLANNVLGELFVGSAYKVLY